jgi:hypothetical protein
VRFNETLSFPVLDFSAAYGALQCYKFLILNGCAPTNHTFTLACGVASKEEMLGFLREFPVVTQDGIAHAMRKGKVNVIGWLCLYLKLERVCNLRPTLECTCLESMLYITHALILENDQATARSSYCDFSGFSSTQHFLAEMHLYHLDADFFA